MNPSLHQAIESVPPGPWAIGVSGGADSVALLDLLRSQAEISLHIVHLDHQTRGAESDGDARFVAELAERFARPITIDNRSRLEAQLRDLPRNPSARFRRLRMELFRRVVQDRGLHGVLLAHHADDQAETILHRLLRGSGFHGLAGMASDRAIGGLRCFRPLLMVARDDLRRWLHQRGQPWREDSSNATAKYFRNRLRLLLRDDASLRDALLELGAASSRLRSWEISAAPEAHFKLDLRIIRTLPHVLARAMAKQWLILNGVPRREIEPTVVDRLLAMCLDASTPSRSQFPGNVLAARRAGAIENLRPNNPD